MTIRKAAHVDTHTQLEHSPPSEIERRIPETEVPALEALGSNLVWTLIIMLSAVAVGLVNFVFTDVVVRPAIVFWFLLFCPGMVLVRFFRLKNPVMEWTLALALSVTIDGLVASIQLYAGLWSPAGTLSILIGLSLCGAIVQLATGMGYRWRIKEGAALMRLIRVPRSITSMFLRKSPR